MNMHRRDFVKVGAAAACAAALPRSLFAAEDCADLTVMLHGMCSFVRHYQFGQVACLGKLNTPEAGELHLAHEPWLRISARNSAFLRAAATQAAATATYDGCTLPTFRKVKDKDNKNKHWYEANISGWSLQLLPEYHRPGPPVCSTSMLAGYEMFFPKARLKKKDKWAIEKHQAAVFRLGYGDIYPLLPTLCFSGDYQFEPKGGANGDILKRCRDKTGLPEHQVPRPITDRVGYRASVPKTGLRIQFSKLTSKPWECPRACDLDLEADSESGDVVLQVVYRKVEPIAPGAPEPVICTMPQHRLDHFALHYGYVDPGVDENLRPVPRRVRENAKPSEADYVAEIGSALFKTDDVQILVDDTTGCPGYTGPPPPPG